MPCHEQGDFQALVIINLKKINWPSWKKAPANRIELFLAKLTLLDKKPIKQGPVKHFTLFSDPRNTGIR